MKLRRIGREERGAAVAEFVLIMPVFLMVFFLVIEISRLWMTVGVVAEAAREGARTAAVTTPFASTDAVTRMNAVLTGASLTASSTPTASCSASPCVTGSTITTTVRVQFDTPIPLLNPIFGGPRTITQTAQMRFE